MDASICCAICKEIVKEDGIELTSKGVDGVNRASEERGDKIVFKLGDFVHKECRRSFCRPSSIRKAKRSDEEANHAGTDTPRLLRPRDSLTNRQFDFKTDCFLCGNEIDEELERRRSRQVCRVRTLDIQKAVLSACEERGDAWAETVRARALHVHDLPAADAIYHHTCSTNFRTKMQMPSQFAPDQPSCKKRKIGRPQNEELNDAFLKVVHFLEDNDDEQLTVSDLVKKMQEVLGESANKPYSNRYMKDKLEEHFGENIIITNLHGKPNLVTLRKTAASILNEFHAKDANPVQEKMNIVETAAKLIRSDIKLVSTCSEKYPSVETDVHKHLELLPPSLKL